MAAMQRRCAAHGVIAGRALLQHMPQRLVAILAIGQPPQLFAVLRLDAPAGWVAASVSRQCMR